MRQDNHSWHRPEPASADWADREREALRAQADIIATLLDSSFVIPGTSIRIGLDPLLGLIPGIGDLIANAVGSTILFLAARLQVPRIVLARMSLNLLINTLVGSIPGIGDLFSIWYKSNLQNARLLQKYSRKHPGQTTTASWIFVIGLIVGIALLSLSTVFIILWTLRQLWELSG